MDKYITAWPETTVSIIQYGKLPDVLPSYMNDSPVELHDTAKLAAHQNSTNFHQLFVIAIDPSIIFSTCDVIFKAINIECVEKIISYSERSEGLLKNLLPDHKRPLLAKQPDCFAEAKKNLEKLSKIDLPTPAFVTISSWFLRNHSKQRLIDVYVSGDESGDGDYSDDELPASPFI
jgi:hypothetical protein